MFLPKNSKTSMQQQTNELKSPRIQESKNPRIQEFKIFAGD